MGRLVVKAAIDFDDLLGFWMDAANCQVQMNVVGVLVQGVHRLVPDQTHLFEQNTHGLFDLLRRRLLTLTPRHDPVLHRQVTDFRKYHEAVGADRYRVTSIRLRENGTKSAFVLDKRGGNSVGFTTREIAWRMGEMQRLEQRGENLYYTPLSAKRHHILIDDLSGEKLQRFLSDGYKPAVVIESSPGNYQAVLNVPKVGLSNEQDVANRLCRVLNQRYGDPNLSGAIHPHRAPGFTNRKPARRPADGSFPEVRLAYAEARECSKALTDAVVIARELDQMALAAKSQSPSPRYAAVPGGLAELYDVHRQDILTRQAGGHIDLSRVDAMVAVRLRLTGHDLAEIVATLETCAPAVRQTTEGRNWHDYAQRTARYAYGPEGALTAARLDRYRDYFLQLEGRQSDYKRVSLCDLEP